MSAKRKQREIAPKQIRRASGKTRPSERARRAGESKLKVVAGTDTPPGPPPADTGKKSAAPSAATPEGSDRGTVLKRGAVVLVLDDDDVDNAWFTCDVTHVDGDTLTLRWQRWPHLPKISRKLAQVALLPEMVKP